MSWAKDMADLKGSKPDVVEQFAELFEGRKDAYGTEEGGCFRVTSMMSPFDWAGEHLAGIQALGVYPMVPHNADFGDEWKVKWGCADFDIKTKGKPSWDYEDEAEAHVAAVNLQKVLSHLSVQSWIERTRSNGRHVWVFCETWVSASVMRRALLVATSVAGTTSREVNPKQETLGPNQLGNYVRLPYPGGLQPTYDGSRCIVDDDAGRTLQIALRWFVEHAIASRCTAAQLQAIADKWVEPEKPKIAFDSQPFTRDAYENGAALKRLNAVGRAVYANGPVGDRSTGMSYVAWQARCSGLSPTETFALLKGMPWNKYHGRPDEDIRLQELITGAFQ